MSTSPRIERGAALLDQHAPGWTKRIDLATLDLGSESYCVLGQVYGSYGIGLMELDGEAANDPERFGFEARGITEEYPTLTARWVLYIAKRLRRES